MSVWPLSTITKQHLKIEFGDPEQREERYTLTIQKLSGMRPAEKANLTKNAAIELMNATNPKKN